MTKTIKEKLMKADEYLKKHGDVSINEQKVIVKYFYPMGRYTFYVISGEEIDGDMIMFGYCLSAITPGFDEYGYVSLSELESVPLMERDLYSSLGVLGDYVTN